MIAFAFTVIVFTITRKRIRNLSSTNYIIEMCQNMFVRPNNGWQNKYWTIYYINIYINFYETNVQDICYSNERLLS